MYMSNNCETWVGIKDMNNKNWSEITAWKTRDTQNAFHEI